MIVLKLIKYVLIWKAYLIKRNFILCEIDWGALATISVAFFVYRTWQTQKRKEVLSCIADNLYEDIGNIKFSLIFIHDTLFNLIMNNFPNLNQKERKDHLESTFQNFNSLCYRITIKLKQLNANENNEVYISLMESLDSVQKSLNQNQILLILSRENPVKY